MGGGGGGGSKSETTTQNQDNRVAVQDGIGVSSSTGNTVNYNDTDAVQAIAALGAETIAKTGEAIVNLSKSTSEANATAWDATVKAGASLVDKLIDRSAGLAQTAMTNYQPPENKANDTSLKLGMIAAAGVAATILLSKTK
jgi:hypothetical protein